MDPSTSVWVVGTDPNIAPGLPALLGERARVGSTIFFKTGPLDTDWTPGTGGSGGIISITGTAGRISVTAGPTPVVDLVNTAVTPGSYTYTSLTVDASGRITAAANGTTPAPVDATYIVQTPNGTLTNEQALSTLATGVLSSTTATGVVASTTFSTGSIPFGASSILSQDNSNLFWNASTLRMGIGTNTPDQMLHVHRSQDTLTAFQVSNPSAGANVYTGYFVANSSTPAAAAGYLVMDLYGTNTNFGDGEMARTAHLRLHNETGAPLVIGTDTNAGPIRFRVAGLTPGADDVIFNTSGAVDITNLAAGGVVYATAASGRLKIGTSAEVAGAITWPSAGRVLFSTGATTAPGGNISLRWDDDDSVFWIGTSAHQRHFNLGGYGDANTEYVRAFWTGNVWTLKSEKSGTGTVRPMFIDADTAYLRMNGSEAALPNTTWYNLGSPGAATYERWKTSWQSNTFVIASESVGGTVRGMTIDGSTASVLINSVSTTIQGGSGAPQVTAANLKIAMLAPTTRARSAGATLDAIDVGPDTIQITGAAGTNITTAGGFNYYTIRAPTYDGGGNATTVSIAASLIIEGPPVGVDSCTISHACGIWVKDGISEFSGDAMVAGVGKNLGFFGSTGNTKQTPSGSRGGNAALASLLTALVAYGLITDGTSA